MPCVVYQKELTQILASKKQAETFIKVLPGWLQLGSVAWKGQLTSSLCLPTTDQGPGPRGWNLVGRKISGEHLQRAEGERLGEHLHRAEGERLGNTSRGLRERNRASGGVK